MRRRVRRPGFLVCHGLAGDCWRDLARTCDELIEELRARLQRGFD